LAIFLVPTYDLVAFIGQALIHKTVFHLIWREGSGRSTTGSSDGTPTQKSSPNVTGE
jgi:hypothetical protein